MIGSYKKSHFIHLDKYLLFLFLVNSLYFKRVSIPLWIIFLRITCSHFENRHNCHAFCDIVIRENVCRKFFSPLMRFHSARQFLTSINNTLFPHNGTSNIIKFKYSFRLTVETWDSLVGQSLYNLFEHGKSRLLRSQQSNEYLPLVPFDVPVLWRTAWRTHHNSVVVFGSHSPGIDLLVTAAAKSRVHREPIMSSPSSRQGTE